MGKRDRMVIIMRRLTGIMEAQTEGILKKEKVVKGIGIVGMNDLMEKKEAINVLWEAPLINSIIIPGVGKQRRVGEIEGSRNKMESFLGGKIIEDNID